MNTIQLINYVQDIGGRIDIKGEKLVITDPQGALDFVMLSYLRWHKTEIISILRYGAALGGKPVSLPQIYH